MNNRKKIANLFLPFLRIHFIFHILFVAAAAAFGYWTLAAAETLLLLALAIFSLLSAKRRHQNLLTYIEAVSCSADRTTRDSLQTMPIPMVIFNLDSGRVLWGNQSFLSASGNLEHFFEVLITDMAPGLDLHWLHEGHSQAPDYFRLNDKAYLILGSIIRIDTDNSSVPHAVLYWLDVSDYDRLQRDYALSRPVIALIVMDNYDELFKNMIDTAKSAFLAALDARINEWTKPAEGYLSKTDRDKYIFIFEEQYLQNYIDTKFSILDSAREIHNPSGIPATLSIGIGKGASSFQEGYQFAAISIEMALSRGGDQAVIKNNLSFEFYGGHTVTVERGTKVKSRVMANAIGELISDASNIIIMGHKNADLDCIGAAAGICAIARIKDKTARIVFNPETNVAMPMVKKLMALPEYKDVFISAQDAMLLADSRTLLVVADTNRPEQTESEPLLASCNKIAVIDHHRRASEYISNPVFNFHETYASSASELVTELLQYLMQPSDILKTEAEAILSGIVLDTKNFTMRTGSRTFEAAAFLRRTGSDITEVKRMFQSDFKSTVERYSIINNADIYRDGIAVSAPDGQVDRIIAAKAADELINITGIKASFVIFQERDTVCISARSIGEINVQLIVEKLGGGGNMAMAGAQIKDSTKDQVLDTLHNSIDTYMDNFS